MNHFFESLKNTGIKQCALSITYDNEMVSVSILPKINAKDKSLKSIKPLDLFASVKEMDEKFFEVIKKPMEQTMTVFDSVKAFEESLKVSESKTESAKKQKESIVKKNTVLQKLLKEPSFNPLTDHKKAIELAKEILTLDTEHKDAKKVIDQMAQYESPKLF